MGLLGGLAKVIAERSTDQPEDIEVVPGMNKYSGQASDIAVPKKVDPFIVDLIRTLRNENTSTAANRIGLPQSAGLDRGQGFQGRFADIPAELLGFLVGAQAEATGGHAAFSGMPGVDVAASALGEKNPFRRGYFGGGRSPSEEPHMPISAAQLAQLIEQHAASLQLWIRSRSMAGEAGGTSGGVSKIVSSFQNGKPGIPEIQNGCCLIKI